MLPCGIAVIRDSSRLLGGRFTTRNYRLSAKAGGGISRLPSEGALGELRDLCLTRRDSAYLLIAMAFTESARDRWGDVGFPRTARPYGIYLNSL